MKNTHVLILLTVFSVLALATISGCLETPEAAPARVSSEALSTYGWAQAGDVVYESREQPVSDITTVTINTATTTYQDEQLVDEIVTQIRDLQYIYDPNTDIEIPRVGSQLITLRIVLPAGIELPASVTSGIIDSQIKSISSQNNIQNFKKVGSTELTIDDGSVATVNTYSGTVPVDSASIDVVGILALWSSSNSNIIAIGIVPDGDIKLIIGSLEQTIITINGDKELNDVAELIKTIS